MVIVALGSILVGSCKSVPNRHSEYHRRAELYLKKYGVIQQKIDTVIWTGSVMRIYRKGILSRVGQVFDESKYNEFYEYNSNGNLIAVLSCKGDSCSVKMLGNPDW